MSCGPNRIQVRLWRHPSGMQQRPKQPKVEVHLGGLSRLNTLVAGNCIIFSGHINRPSVLCMSLCCYSTTLKRAGLSPEDFYVYDHERSTPPNEKYTFSQDCTRSHDSIESVMWAEFEAIPNSGRAAQRTLRPAIGQTPKKTSPSADTRGPMARSQTAIRLNASWERPRSTARIPVPLHCRAEKRGVRRPWGLFTRDYSINNRPAMPRALPGASGKLNFFRRV